MTTKLRIWMWKILDVLAEPSGVTRSLYERGQKKDLTENGRKATSRESSNRRRDPAGCEAGGRDPRAKAGGFQK